MRDVFASNNNFSELDGVITTENSNFTWPNDLVTFFDSHDESRLLTLNNNQNRLQEAMAFLITCRGIPVILYGDEQYLHNDTNSGNDPYNRVAMTSFSTTTTAYKLISKLAGLRQANNALGYGTWRQRWINGDVYIYERQFFNDVVLVAINKNDTTAQPISGLDTALPAGTYADYLGGLQSGISLTVASGSGGNNPANNLSLPAHSVSVWQASSAATTPEVGSIGPTVGQPGMPVTHRRRWLRQFARQREGQRHSRYDRLLVQHICHLHGAEYRWRHLDRATGRQPGSPGQHHPVHRAHCETDPRHLHGEQRHAYQPRRLYLSHRQHCRTRQLEHHLRHRRRPHARSELSQLVPECLRARGPKHPVQVHQDRSKRHRHLGKRREPLVHRSHERHRIRQCNLAELMIID